MNFRKLLVYVVIIFYTVSYSQTKNKADKLFEDHKYNLAIKEYLSLIEQTDKIDILHIQLRLAESYYNLFNYNQSIYWFEKVLEYDPNPEHIFKYAEMLKASGNYRKAAEQMQFFQTILPNDTRSIIFSKSVDFAGFENQHNEIQSFKPSDINTDKDEFGGYIHENNFYFISNRERKNAQKKNSDRTGKIFTNIYQGNWNVGTIENIEEFRELNSRWNDEAIAISPNNKYLYITSESYNLIFNKKYKTRDKFIDGNFAIFRATRKKNKFWYNFEPLNFIEKEYSYKDPYLTSDGKVLYFSSNMPGGFGGMDVWKVEIYSDGSYGNPVNLGENINTPLDETTPFYKEKTNELYFSSNGHLGYGGLDIFKIKYNNATTEPINLGNPINSKGNDFGFIYFENKKIGFISSDRKGNLDIFEFEEIPLTYVKFNVQRKDKHNNVENVKISIFDKNGILLTTKISDSKGNVMFVQPKNKELIVEIEKEDFISERFTFSTPSKADMTKNLEVILTPIEIKQK